MKTAPQLHRLQTAIILILFLFVNAFPAIAQNVKDEQIEYQYIKLPLTPLSFTPKNYQASIFATFEAENAKLQAAYEADLAVAEAEYQTAMAAYPGQVQDAKLAYEKALAEWNEKSLAEKVVEKQYLMRIINLLNIYHLHPINAACRNLNYKPVMIILLLLIPICN